MKPSKKLEGSSILWDNAYIAEPALGKCIKATDNEFTAVANYLLSSVALAYPDEGKLDELVIEDFNSFLRNAAHRIAIQMLTLISNCGLVEGGMRLRQKSGFPCVMQQEQSEGVWVDVFDYALCLEGALTDALEQQTSSQDAKDIINGAMGVSNEMFQEYDDKYTGTSASYDPRLVLTGELDDDALNALCATVTETVEKYVQAGIDTKTAQTDNLGRAALGIGAGIAIISILALAVAFPPFALGVPTLFAAMFTLGNAGIAGTVLGATATGLGIWAQVIKDNDIAPLENDAAVSRLVCLWFTQLKANDDISLEDYRAALDLSEESIDVQKIWEMITPLIQMELSYAAFLTAWKKNTGYVEAGEPVEDCGCDEPQLDMLWPGSTWDDTVFDFIGLDEMGNETWEYTLSAAGLNGGDAIYFTVVNAGTQNPRDVKVLQTTYVSGSAAPGAVYWNGAVQSGGIVDPSQVGTTLLAYGATFPFVIRLKLQPQPLP